MTHGGHADFDTVRYVEQLEHLIAERVPVESVLKLAQLSVEPLHREDIALTLVDFVRRFEPGNARACLLHAYLSIHYLIVDEALVSAEVELTDLIARGQEVGAAAVLLDEVRRRMSPADRDDANIELLQLSVGAEPAWSINHLRLGRALRARGDDRGALAEMEIAIACLSGPDSDPAIESFEDCFTGRRASRDRLVAERDRI
jgi:hypothetical protein